MTIRTRIIVFQAFFIGLLLVMGAVVYLAISRADYYIERVTLAHRQLETITSLSLHANQYSEQIAEMLLFGEEGLPDVERAQREVERSFAALRQATADEDRFVAASGATRRGLDENALIEQMHGVAARMHRTALELLEVQRAGRPDEARRRYQAEIEDDLDNQLQDLIDLAVADEREEVRRVDARTAGLARELTFAVGATTLAGLVAGAVAVMLLSRALSRPIARLTEGAEAIGGGHLSHRIPVEGRDELALLSGHFNRMAEQLQSHHAELLAEQALLERKVGERTAELAEANGRLEEANKRLKDLDRLRVLFLADVSHELRTPLTVLRGEAEVTLRSRASSPDDYRETLERVVEQAEQMGGLVDDLLFLTRAEADSIRFEIDRVDLRDVFGEVLDWARVLAASGGNELAARFPDGPLPILGDRQRLKQTALIAVDNAIKYAHPRSLVEVELADEGGQAVARVRNRGDGVPPEDLPYVFDRFYRGRHATRVGGSGLGLSIAKWIVEKHGGAIALTSEPGGVTELEIRLPRAAPADDHRGPGRRDRRFSAAPAAPPAQSFEMV
jgi:two-component system, OmpR family, sensor kinase